MESNISLFSSFGVVASCCIILLLSGVVMRKLENFSKAELIKEIHNLRSQISAFQEKLDRQSQIGYPRLSEDITEEQRSLEILKNQQAYLESIFRAAPAGIGVVKDRIFQMVNRKFCEMVGYSRNELIGKGSQMIYPDKREYEFVGKQKYQQIIEKGIGAVETKFQRKDGTIINVLLSSTPIDPNDFSKGITFTALDITARKQSEQALRQSEQRYRTFVESLPDIVFITDCKSRMLYANPALKRQTGFTVEDFQRHHRKHEFIHPEDTDRVAKFIDNFIKSEAQFSDIIEHRFIDKFDRIHWYSTIIARIEYEGEPALQFITRNITEQKKAIHALKKSQERLELILDSAEIGLWDHNLKTGKVIRSKHWAQMLGYKLEEMGDDVNFWKSLIHPEDLPFVQKVAQDHESGKTPHFKVEHRMKTKDGQWKWILNWGKIIERDQQGHPTRALGTHLDITDQKLALEAIKENEKRFRLIVQNMPMLIVAFGNDGKIIFWNRQCTKITGYTSKEMTGKVDALKKLFPDPHYRKQILIKWRKQQNKFSDWILTLTTKKGRQRTISWYNITAEVQIPSWAFWVIGIDVTDRIKAENQLRESHRKLQINLNYFSSMDKISQTISNSSSLDSMIKGCLKNLLQIFGIDRAWMLYPCDPSSSAFEIEYEITRPGYPSIETNNMKFSRSQINIKIISELLAVDGPVAYDIKNLNFRTTPLVKKFHVKSLLAIAIKPSIRQAWALGLHQCSHLREWTSEDKKLFKDIAQRMSAGIDNLLLYQNMINSERKIKQYSENLEKMVTERTNELEIKTKKLQESQQKLTHLLDDVNKSRNELEHLNQQLEYTNKELEAFVYSVSHDLRAPLRHIEGFTEILMKNIWQSLNDKNRHYLNNVSDAVKQMGQLIDDLLIFSRMGRVEMHKIRVDLSIIIQEIMTELELEIKDRDINWKINPLPIVDGDPSLLHQVMLNLISNAAKFTRNRKKARIEIGSRSTNNETIIFIKDNGTGFDMKYADKLFGVFQRLHHKDEFEGTGIGLANVRRIIHRHNGRVWAEGKTNKGATFYFSLPKHGGR